MKQSVIGLVSALVLVATAFAQQGEAAGLSKGRKQLLAFSRHLASTPLAMLRAGKTMLAKARHGSLLPFRASAAAEKAPLSQTAFGVPWPAAKKTTLAVGLMTLLSAPVIAGERIMLDERTWADMPIGDSEKACTYEERKNTPVKRGTPGVEFRPAGYGNVDSPVCPEVVLKGEFREGKDKSDCQLAMYCDET